jgi:hypothetical protein
VASSSESGEPKKSATKSVHATVLSPQGSKSGSRPVDAAPTSGVAAGLRLKTD